MPRCHSSPLSLTCLHEAAAANAKLKAAFCISKEAAAALARDVLLKLQPSFKLCDSALHIVHEATEAYLIDLQEETQACAVFNKRNFINLRDIKLALRIRRASRIQ